MHTHAHVRSRTHLNNIHTFPTHTHRDREILRATMRVAEHFHKHSKCVLRSAYKRFKEVRFFVPLLRVLLPLCAALLVLLLLFWCYLQTNLQTNTHSQTHKHAHLYTYRVWVSEFALVILAECSRASTTRTCCASVGVCTWLIQTEGAACTPATKRGKI